MELEFKLAFNAGLDNVLAVFLDENAIHEKNRHLGSRNLRVPELRRDEHSAKLVMERELTNTAEVPGILQSFHREWNTVRQEEHWFRKDDGEWHCEFRVKIEGVPAKIRGVMRLQGTHQACINFVNLKVRCEIPLIGKKIAEFLAEDTRAKVESEYRVIQSLLQPAVI